MAYADKKMDHNAYPKKMKSKSKEALLFIISDAKAAMKANPENPNNSFYADEVCYAASEIHRRRELRKKEIAAFNKKHS